MNLNLNTVKRSRFTLTLNDADQTAVTLLSPLKFEAEDFARRYRELGTSKNVTEDDFNEFIADLLTNNEEKKAFSTDWVKNNMSLEDKAIFLNAYNQFLLEIKNQKN